MSPNAPASLRDGTKAGKREQTVLTGEPILALLQTFWGRTALDPCAPPDGPIIVPCDRCKREIKPNCRNCGGAGETEQTYDLDPERAVRLPEDGLAVKWVDRTFCNPPYGALEPWLRDTDVEDRVIWYVPYRPQRRWFRAWAGSLTDLIALNPQRFKGYANQFPAALCLAYRGPWDPWVPMLRALCGAYDLGESICAPREK